jgi:dipeptidyl aminopeptidase/acylaminoacyl peptidase
MKIHRFKVTVSICGKEYDDDAILILPDSYTDNGEKTRLVISCHGAGGTVTTNDSQVEAQLLTSYLLSNGFAVLDVCGLPKKYADEEGIDLFNNIGSPIAVDCYCEGYKYCLEHFNLYSDVFVHGASMGGISSTNLVLSDRVPTIAHTVFCPVLDTYNEIFLHPWSNGLPKIALGKLYGLDKDENGDYIYDESKINGYNPVNNPRIKSYPVPLKIWHCMDDDTVSFSVTENYADTIKSNGGNVELVVFKNGGHEPQLVGPEIEHPCGITDKPVTPAVDGVLEFIKKYS